MNNVWKSSTKITTKTKLFMPYFSILWPYALPRRSKYNYVIHYSWLRKHMWFKYLAYLVLPSLFTPLPIQSHLFSSTIGYFSFFRHDKYWLLRLRYDSHSTKPIISKGIIQWFYYIPKVVWCPWIFVRFCFDLLRVYFLLKHSPYLPLQGYPEWEAGIEHLYPNLTSYWMWATPREGP